MLNFFFIYFGLLWHNLVCYSLAYHTCTPSPYLPFHSFIDKIRTPQHENTVSNLLNEPDISNSNLVVCFLVIEIGLCGFPLIVFCII